MRRVLLVKTSSMGDVLHALPALTDAKKALPDVCFDWVVEENFAQIPRWHPTVDQVLPVALRRWRKNWFHATTRHERHQFVQALQARRYDAVIDAQGLLKSAALITRLSHGPKHGLDWHSAREPLASLFYTHKHPIAKEQHAVERIRQLFADSLGYNRPQEDGDYGIHFAQLEKPACVDQLPYLVFLHATTRDNKHWPESRWLKLLEMTQDSGYQIYLPWGTMLEQERALRLTNQFTHCHVLPKLNLNEVAQVLAHASGVVSVDTGLSHLTAALGRPNITLYGPTDPGLIGGYGNNQFMLISDDKNMASITAEQVFKILRNF